MVKFIHAWGGTTSIQSLECHTLRYLRFPDRIGNSLAGNIFCELNNKHHTVYFDEAQTDAFSGIFCNILYISYFSFGV